jgi:hypothetical protein
MDKKKTETGKETQRGTQETRKKEKEETKVRVLY